MSRPAATLELPRQQPDHEGNDPLPETTVLLAHSLLDMDLAERVERALRATGYSPLRAVEVAVRDRRVLLSGRVPSYYMKQIAQSAVLAVPGVGELCNDLDVAGTR
jgi:osmotically-inducible protein OsmY